MAQSIVSRMPSAQPASAVCVSTSITSQVTLLGFDHGVDLGDLAVIFLFGDLGAGVLLERLHEGLALAFLIGAAPGHDRQLILGRRRLRPRTSDGGDPRHQQARKPSFVFIRLQSPCCAGIAGGCTCLAVRRSPRSSGATVELDCQNASSARQSSVFQPTEMVAPGVEARHAFGVRHLDHEIVVAAAPRRAPACGRRDR